MACHRVAGLTVENCRNPGFCPALIAEALEKQQGIADSPACIGIDPNEAFVTGRYLVRDPVPFEKAFFEIVCLLDEWKLSVKACFSNDFADRTAELRDNHLLGFIGYVHGSRQSDQNGET